jgi:CRISPR-associated protein Csx17
LRLVAEQKHSGARGWWAGDVFHLDSELSEPEVLNFFAKQYRPTPIVAPWNGGSGFAEGDKTEALNAIRMSTEPRFEDYGRAIKTILSWPELPPSGLTIGELLERVEAVASQKKGKARDDILRVVSATRDGVSPAKEALGRSPLAMRIEELEDEISALKESMKTARKGGTSLAPLRSRAATVSSLVSAAKKARTILKKDHRQAGKEDLVTACRDRLTEGAVEWIDAALVIGGDDQVRYPPLLGTGGAEGRLDYSNTFMSRLMDVLLGGTASGHAETLLRSSLFGEATEGLVVASVGQYDPGRAGGYNQGPGIEHKEFPTNPWDFIFALEGTIAWASSVTVRHEAAGPRALASPFTVRTRAVGYASAADNDRQGARAEVWAPLWTRPVTYRELRTFLAEGRAEVGGRPARNSIEFAEAASSLGVDRGVSEFVRYSLLKRRGDSYVALPAGRFPVRARSEADLIRQIDPILAMLDRFLRDFGKTPPARFVAARREVDEALYAALLHGGASRLKAVVGAIGRLERLLAQRDPVKEPRLQSPLSGLKPSWVVGADDGTLEVRMAAALASIGATGEVGPLRANLAPVDPRKPRKWAQGGNQMAWTGGSLAARMTSVLSRRMRDAKRFLCQVNPLRSALRLAPEDVAAFIEGRVDEGLLEDLLFGFTWVRWDDRAAVREAVAELRARWASPVEPRAIQRSYALLKLLFLPAPLPTGRPDRVQIHPEAIVPLLCAGRVGDACRIAQRRLYASGVTPVQAEFTNSENGPRLAAALLIPMRAARRMCGLVLQTDELER